MRKKLALTVGIVLLLTIFATAFFWFFNQPKQPEQVTIHYFFENSCGACPDAPEIQEINQAVLVDLKESYPYEIQTYNAFKSDGREDFIEIAQSYHIDTRTATFPSVIIEGTFIEGLEKIEATLAEQLKVAYENQANGIDMAVENSLQEEMLFDDLEIDATQNTLLYFYRIDCPDCNEVKEEMDGLTKQVQVNGANVETNLMRFNTRSGKNGDRIRELFARYQVPEEDQVVPIVFFTDTYLSGAEEINASLQQSLEEGQGIGLTLK